MLPENSTRVGSPCGQPENRRDYEASQATQQSPRRQLPSLDPSRSYPKQEELKDKHVATFSSNFLSFITNFDLGGTASQAPSDGARSRSGEKPRLCSTYAMELANANIGSIRGEDNQLYLVCSVDHGCHYKKALYPYSSSNFIEAVNNAIEHSNNFKSSGASSGRPSSNENDDEMFRLPPSDTGGNNLWNNSREQFQEPLAAPQTPLNPELPVSNRSDLGSSRLLIDSSNETESYGVLKQHGFKINKNNERLTNEVVSELEDFEFKYEFYNQKFRSELHRLATFQNKWPIEEIITAKELAAAGFFYQGPSDRVKCAFCSGILRGWELGDIALSEHLRHFSDCLFIRAEDAHVEVGNVPLDQNERNGQLEEKLAEICDRIDRFSMRDKKSNWRLNIVPKLPSKHPDKIILRNRLITFEGVKDTRNKKMISWMVNVGFFCRPHRPHPASSDCYDVVCCQCGYTEKI